MALKNGKPNPLNYFGMRRVQYAPPHFEYTSIFKINQSYTRRLVDWIEQNLNNRYYIGQSLALDQNNLIVYVTKIGFESEKDLSFFKIACPLLHER